MVGSSLMQIYHWRELPQVSFLSRQNKHIMILCIFILSRIKLLFKPKQTRLLSRQKKPKKTKTKQNNNKKNQNKTTHTKHTHVFVATNIILVAAPANDTKQPVYCATCSFNSYGGRGVGWGGGNYKKQQQHQRTVSTSKELLRAT